MSPKRNSFFRHLQCILLSYLIGLNAVVPPRNFAQNVPLPAQPTASQARSIDLDEVLSPRTIDSWNQSLSTPEKSLQIGSDYDEDLAALNSSDQPRVGKVIRDLVVTAKGMPQYHIEIVLPDAPIKPVLTTIDFRGFRSPPRTKAQGPIHPLSGTKNLRLSGLSHCQPLQLPIF